MTILEAILQGILQGFTEFLPVSSSGHLSVLQHFLAIDGEEGAICTMILHLGTLAAVFVAFWDKIKKLIIECLHILRDIFTLKFSVKKSNPERHVIFMIIVSILPLFAFYIFKDFFQGLQSDADIIVEGVGFLYTSALLFLSTGKACSKNSLTCERLTARGAVFIGIFQGIALVPGISRSGSTISAGLLTGLKREEAVDYSFILGIPVILAGALVSLLDVVKGEGETEINVPALLVGFVAAAVVGYLAIRLIKLLVVSDKFRIFAYYTLVLGIIVLGIGIFEKISGTRLGSAETASEVMTAMLGG